MLVVQMTLSRLTGRYAPGRDRVPSRRVYRSADQTAALRLTRRRRLSAPRAQRTVAGTDRGCRLRRRHHRRVHAFSGSFARQPGKRTYCTWPTITPS